MRIWKGWCEARDSAKQTERSLKGKGIGDLLRFAKPANRSYGKCDVCNLCAVVINAIFMLNRNVVIIIAFLIPDKTSKMYILKG